MIFVAKYHYKTLKMRKAKKLPDLPDINDLPEVSPDGDVEAHPAKPEDAVLTEEEQRKFHHHQAKFAKSHTYYKPHQTFTHRAFPIDLLITVVVLLDFHSFFQIALGGTTWGESIERSMISPQMLTAPFRHLLQTSTKSIDCCHPHLLHLLQHRWRLGDQSR